MITILKIIVLTANKMVCLDNLSDPDFNTQYCSPDDINTQLITSSKNYFSVLHINIRICIILYISVTHNYKVLAATSSTPF